MDQSFMKEKNILPLVLSMSLPMVISMAVNSFYNIIDSYFVARVSEDAITALALVYPVQNLVNAIAIGFGIGVNAAIAFYLGAGDQRRADIAVTQGVFCSVLHGVLLTVICTSGMPLFLKSFSSDEGITGLALLYSNRVFLFAPVITLELAFEKLFQAVGRMKVSMFSMICGCVANIILDPILIFGSGRFPAMGIAGAAYATGIGQCITLAVYLLFYAFRRPPVQISLKRLCPDTAVLGKLYSVGISGALNLALPSLLISALNGILADFSEKYVLVLGVYYKLQTFIYLTANGIIQGIRPLMGYNYGAGEHGRVKRIYRTALFMNMGIMALGTLLAWTVPGALIGLFTDNGETVSIGITALHSISLGFIVSAVSITCSGALEGLGRGGPSLLISLLRYVIIIIPAAFVLSRFLDADGVWYAFWVTESVTAGLSLIIYKKVTRIKPDI
ncbi:MAG: MATE family efflux transporter [Butyrivibrio sp.]|nr:MATE family efflux transporter [Acetatifactor muris]MCM1558784.1 MATE family efflux transporter [Butyrivibrio sp.]